MAVCACDIAVCADKRKPGFRVVEGLNPAPRVFDVTAFALLPKPALVRIIRFVAINAASRCLSKFRMLGVAGTAIHALVRARECEVRVGVVEGLFVQLDDVECPPLVIGVAMPAFILQGVRVPPMIAAVSLSIGGNILVAIEAKPGLRLS
jgi:hypothetical protein